MTFQVTPDILQLPIARGCPDTCASIAIQRVTRSGLTVTTDRRRRCFWVHSVRRLFEPHPLPIPDTVMDSIYRYDSGRRLLPFEFELPIPAEFLEPLC